MTHTQMNTTYTTVMVTHGHKKKKIIFSVNGAGKTEYSYGNNETVFSLTIHRNQIQVN